MGLAKPESLLDDPDEHVRTWAIRLLTDAWPIDSLFGPRPNLLPKGDPKLEKKFVQLAKSDPSGLVRLGPCLDLAAPARLFPWQTGPSLGRSPEDAQDHNLPAMVWYGITPMAEFDPEDLARGGPGDRWTNLREWIARSIDRPGQGATRGIAGSSRTCGWNNRASPIPFGMERGGSRDQESRNAPENWSRLRAKTWQASILRLSVLFGDEGVLDDFADLADDGRSRSTGPSADPAGTH